VKQVRCDDSLVTVLLVVVCFSSMMQQTCNRK
jgi:hypothetical protein